MNRTRIVQVHRNRGKIMSDTATGSQWQSRLLLVQDRARRVTGATSPVPRLSPPAPINVSLAARRKQHVYRTGGKGTDCADLSLLPASMLPNKKLFKKEHPVGGTDDQSSSDGLLGPDDETWLITQDDHSPGSSVTTLISADSSPMKMGVPALPRRLPHLALPVGAIPHSPSPSPSRTPDNLYPTPEEEAEGGRRRHHRSLATGVRVGVGTSAPALNKRHRTAKARLHVAPVPRPAVVSPGDRSLLD